MSHSHTFLLSKSRCASFEAIFHITLLIFRFLTAQTKRPIHQVIVRRRPIFVILCEKKFLLFINYSTLNEVILVPTFDFLTLQCWKKMEGIMSNDQDKKLIVEKLQSDAGLRERVADLILSRGFLSNFDNLKSVRKEIPAQQHNGDEYCNKNDGSYSYLSSNNGGGCPFEGRLHGYEHWVG